MISETVTLATARYTVPKKANGGTCAIQLVSSDLSADTTFSVQVSVDGLYYDIATANGTDVTDTLVANTSKVIQLEMVHNLYYKLVFDGVTTGTIIVKILD